MADKREKRRGLGRGLSALMADVETAPVNPGQETTATPAERMIPVEKIQPNPDQPRRRFSETDMQELTESIRAKGVIQPLIVRVKPGSDGMFEIVAGERRWRAAQMAQVHELPVIVRDFTDTEVLEIAIIENIQRADLNAVEEALGYRQLMDRFGHTQEKMAAALGKSRSHIANLLRLLSLPEDVLDFVRQGDLSAGHARALITSENPSALAKTVIAQGWSVRETEKAVKAAAAGPKTTGVSSPRGGGGGTKDADTKALEGDLSAHLGMKVLIDHQQGGEGGKITLHYTSLEQLDDLCRMLSES